MSIDISKANYKKLFPDEKTKAMAFDKIAEEYYYMNFGRMSKADLDTLLNKIVTGLPAKKTKKLNMTADRVIRRLVFSVLINEKSRRFLASLRKSFSPFCKIFVFYLGFHRFFGGFRRFTSLGKDKPRRHAKHQ